MIGAILGPTGTVGSGWNGSNRGSLMVTNWVADILLNVFVLRMGSVRLPCACRAPAPRPRERSERGARQPSRLRVGPLHLCPARSGSGKPVFRFRHL